MSVKRTAKPRGPDPPTLGSSLQDGDVGPNGPDTTQATVARKPGHRGERGVSRKPIAQGMPDCFGEPVVTNSCAFYVAHEAAGASITRHSLRPLIIRGTTMVQNSGDACRENAEVCLIKPGDDNAVLYQPTSP